MSGLNHQTTLIRFYPTTGAVQISYELTKSGNVGIEIYDLSGKMIAQKQYPNQSPGMHVYDYLPTSGGMYLLKLRVNDAFFSRKLVVANHY